MLARNALDRALVHHRVVGGAQRVGLVVQRELELARRRLGDRAFERDALGIGGGPQVAQQRGGVLELGQAVGLRSGRLAPVERRAPQRGGAAAPRLDEVELELAGNHRGQPVGSEALDHPGKHRARVEVVDRPVELVQRGHDLRHVDPEPRRGHQRAGHRHGQPVGVAVLPDQPGILAVAAEDVDHEHRAREEAAVLVDVEQLVAAQSLAARHAAHSGEEQLDERDVGMRFEEGHRLARIGGETGAGRRRVHRNLTLGIVASGRRASVCDHTRTIRRIRQAWVRAQEAEAGKRKGRPG